MPQQMVVLDRKPDGGVYVNGVKVPGYIGQDVDVEDLGSGLLHGVNITLLADDVLEVSRSGSMSSPSARTQALAIVREGLRDVLDWLGER